MTSIAMGTAWVNRGGKSPRRELKRKGKGKKRMMLASSITQKKENTKGRKRSLW
jgi:hypothetical protein